MLPLMLIAAALAVGCDPEDNTDAPTNNNGSAIDISSDKLDFPEALKVEDQSVNTFLAHAIMVCTSEDYEAFRLLWSAREEPLGREEFAEGWHAVTSIRIRAVEKVRLDDDKMAAPQIVYAVLADVTFDPMSIAGRKEPQRSVTMMLVREHDEWRFARPPKRMRAWLKEKMQQAESDSADDSDAEPTAPTPRSIPKNIDKVGD